MRAQAWLLLLGCASQTAAPPNLERAGVRRFGRSPGMAIGTAGESSAQAELDDGADMPAELSRAAQPAIPEFAAAPARPLDEAAPCGGCVELQLEVSDINQRDEFAIALGGVRLRRVVWTVLVNFNSDQLAVQPFMDDVYGKYTALHVNTFPLATPVEVAQELDEKSRARQVQKVGLKVGSSGAWTGNQTMSVFVSQLRMEGPDAVEISFDAGPDGLLPRTRSRNPRVVFHALQSPAPLAGGGGGAAAVGATQ